MAIGQWWLFDRSLSGFLLGVTVSFTATTITQIIVHYGMFRLAHNNRSNKSIGLTKYNDLLFTLIE